MELTDCKRLVAAKAVIKNARGQILVLQQSHEAGVSNAGLYHLPGGIVEPHETITTGLAREVYEETGRTATIGNVVHVGEWEATIRGEQHAFVGIFYACTIDDGEIAVDLAESVGYRWITKADLATIAVIEPAYSIIAAQLN